MAEIQSATAEIRRGKNKKEERYKPQVQNIMSASATQGGHNKYTHRNFRCGDGQGSDVHMTHAVLSYEMIF